MTARLNTQIRLHNVDPKLAKQVCNKLRVYSDGEKVHVLHWRSGEQCSLPHDMHAVADAIRAALDASDNDYSAVVPALRAL